VKGLSASDLNQGTLGNCWFIAACSALALERRLWEKVVVNHTEQEWDPDHPENYAGIFHFHIWQFGEWVDVVIDDYLPTINGKLIYAKSQDANEFWSAFLEKAFAKLAGSYEALAGGFTSEALIDFTGGVSEVIPLNYFTDENDRDKKNFDYIIEAHEHQAMISCSIALAEGDQVDQIMDCGLVKGHAYTVVAVKRMKLETGLRAFFNNKEKLMMVKMRNPWGKKEWNGPWSDDSKEWNRVPKSEQDKMELKVENDGEFWMEFHDWRTFFTHCTVCHIVNTRVLTLRKTWNDSIFHGKWQGRSAGGSVNNLDTFFNNPQYSFTLREEQEIMVSLMQKDPRANRRRRDTTRADPAPAFTIGFLILKVEVNRDHRIHRLRAEAGRVTFINMRQVFGRFKLSQGRYCIIPSTFEPNQEREFLLRIYTEQNVRAREWKTDAPSRGIGGFLCPCCVKPYRGMVSVHVHGAQGLAKQDLTGAGMSSPSLYLSFSFSLSLILSKPSPSHPYIQSPIIS
jgi:calpain-5